MTLLDLLFMLFIILYATLNVLDIVYKCNSTSQMYNVTISPIYDIEHPKRHYAFSIYREDDLLQFI